LLKEFDRYRESIRSELFRYLSGKERELRRVNGWASDFLDRLARFGDRGKMIRGCLVFRSYHLFRRDAPPDLARAAAAVEILQSSLLIHDDIMDRDRFRRGARTIYSQYEELAAERGARDAHHIGQSMGICGGDIGYFLAFELLSSIGDPDVRSDIIDRWARELVAVGLAQMDDIALTAAPADAGAEDIINLYRFKTARYTFSLPLVTGALLAAQPGEVLKSLEVLGEVLGIIFQIKDDELGLYGETERTGKPVGKDVQEGKRTLFAFHLQELIDGGGGMLAREDADSLRSLLSGRALTAEDLESLRRIASEGGVLKRIDRHIRELSLRAEDLIAGLPLSEATREERERAGEARAFFRRMLDFNLRRTR
jgi:geranylgeranyl diphosphate synthase type I